MKIGFKREKRRKKNFFFVYACVICERGQFFEAKCAIFSRFLGWKLLDCEV